MGWSKTKPGEQKVWTTLVIFHNAFACFDGIPETTQLNLTLASSDTALDFKVDSNVGCVSSVN